MRRVLFIGPLRAALCPHNSFAVFNIDHLQSVHLLWNRETLPPMRQRRNPGTNRCRGLPASQRVLQLLWNSVILLSFYVIVLVPAAYKTCYLVVL